MEEQSFEEMKREWGREMSFTPIRVRCSKCQKTEDISMGSGGCHEMITGYICEACEPSDD